MDLDLTYLPRGSAFALLDVLRVLYTAEKNVRIVSMSELNVADLKSNHVVYIGYISALDKLEDFVFGSSTLAVGDTYDELRNKDTGELYTSEAGIHGSRPQLPRLQLHIHVSRPGRQSVHDRCGNSRRRLDAGGARRHRSDVRATRWSRRCPRTP